MSRAAPFFKQNFCHGLGFNQSVTKNILKNDYRFNTQKSSCSKWPQPPFSNIAPPKTAAPPGFCHATSLAETAPSSLAGYACGAVSVQAGGSAAHPLPAPPPLVRTPPSRPIAHRRHSRAGAEWLGGAEERQSAVRVVPHGVGRCEKVRVCDGRTGFGDATVRSDARRPKTAVLRHETGPPVLGTVPRGGGPC